MPDEQPSFTPINNPEGATEEQRQSILEGMAKGLIHGKPEGIVYLTKQDAQKLIDRMRRGR